jgi:hypothetical protein
LDVLKEAVEEAPPAEEKAPPAEAAAGPPEPPAVEAPPSTPAASPDARAPAAVEIAGGQAHEPDGPFEADGFRFQGAEVHFRRAAKQFSLILALWDSANHCPHPARPVEDVITDVYGENNDTGDTAFRQLCFDTRRRLEAEHFPLTINTLQGKASLKSLSL